MAIPYLETFLESLEPLPAELQRNFKLMTELDQRTEAEVKKISHESEEYMNHVNSLKPNEKVKRFNSIHDRFQKAKDFSDDKVQLAMQTYEMVDRHIRKLDNELAKLDAEMKEKQAAVAASSTTSSKTTEEPVNKKKKAGKNDGKKKGLGVRALFEGKQEEDPVLPVVPLQMLTQGSEVVLDMPVDPNEPTYCVCHQVSYGEMIGCDNVDCPIEWFHFGCVGLTQKPKGKWFCPKCTSDRKKK